MMRSIDKPVSESCLAMLLLLPAARLAVGETLMTPRGITALG